MNVILKDEIKKDSLDLSSKNIHTVWLSSIVHINLRYLNIAYNPLVFLPDIYTLKVLIVNDCRLRELPSYMPALEELDCSNNELRVIPYYDKLTTLACSGNYITTLPQYTNSTLIIADNCPILTVHYSSGRSGTIQNGKFTWVVNNNLSVSNQYVLINWQKAKCTVSFKSKFMQRLSRFLFT